MSRLPLAAFAAVAAVLLTPAGALAAIEVTPLSTEATPVGGSGFVAPGDRVRIIETIRNEDPEESLDDVAGTLSRVTPDVVVTQATSAYGAIGGFGTKPNATPFEADLPPTLECGQDVRFSLAITATQGSATVQFDVPTGAADSPRTYTATGEDVVVTDAGRVKGVGVRIEHPSAELHYVLRAPDGAQVTLHEADGQPGVFVGSFRSLHGQPTQGTWRLEAGGQPVGTWSLDLAPATCTREPRAAIIATPRVAGPGQTVTFDARGSSVPSGTIGEYQWDFDGDGVFDRTTTTTEAATQYAYVAGGTYTARVRIEEGGDDSIATTVVEVTEPPTALVTASPATPSTFDAVSLDASGSVDPDGSILRYDWDFNDDGVLDQTTTAATTSTSFVLPGDRTVRVRVVDNQGATATATTVVEVQNRPPTAALADPGVVGAGRDVTLDASHSHDPDDGIVRYEWDLDGVGGFERDGGSSPTLTHVFPLAGLATVRVQVTDAAGGVAQASVPVVVTEPPLAALTAGPNPARPGQTVAFDASQSRDLDGTIARYVWDLDGNGSFETDTATVATTSRSYPIGTYGVRVRVTDDRGVSSTSEPLAVVVENRPPVAALTVSAPVIAGRLATFDASGSWDPDGVPLAAYAWDLDNDGSFELGTGTSPVASRAYPNAGTITVRVRVTDVDGGTDVEPLTFQVAAPPSDGSSGSGGSGGGATGTGAGGAGGSGGAIGDPAGSGAGGAGLGQAAPLGGAGSGTGAGAAGGGDNGFLGSSVPRGPLRASLLGSPIQGMRLATRRGLGLLCRADRAATCTVTATLAPAQARRLRMGKRSGAPVVIGRATVKVSAGRDARVTLRLSATARRRLKRADRVTVLLRGSARSAGGQRVTMTRAVLLRR